MHDFRLSPEIVARVERKQGRAHTCERIEAPRTALVVIDMQNYFLAPGQQFETPTGRAIVPNINRLADALRRTGGRVYWIENAADPWPSYEERYAPEQWRRRIEALTPGDFGYELWPELDVRPEDERVVKRRFSPFIAGSSDLEERLRAGGVDTLLVTGVATNICCETAGRDAMMLGFRTLMVSDANATVSDAEHRAALEAFYLYFGDVQTTEEVVSRLISGGAQRSAAQ